MFTLTATSTDRVRAAALANGLADLYILDQLETKFLGTQQATEWLSGRVADLRADLEADEAAVKALRAASDLISVDGLEAINRQAKDLRDRLALAVAAQAGAADRRADLEQADGDPAAMTAVVADARSGLQADSDANISGRFASVLDQARREAARAAAQAAALEVSLTALEVNIAEQSLDLVQLQHLEREADASRAIYESFLARLKETTVQEGVQRADSRILSYATIPNFPAEPNKRRIVLSTTGLIALIVAAALILWEVMQKGIRTAADLERLTGTPVLGQTPLIPGRSQADRLHYLIEKPNSAAAEAVRNLRTSVLLSDGGGSTRVIMVTSSVPDEGKTTQVVALAQNFAALGKRVLLIEGDIRRPGISEFLSRKPGGTLLSVLSGAALPQDCVHHDAASGVDLLVGEPSPVSAADLFSTPAWSGLLDWARDQYQVILVDTPPVLVVPDARVIGQQADVILYAVQWDKTAPAQVQDGLRMLASVGLKVSGLVLSQVDPRGMRRYGLASSSGAYARYGQPYFEG